MTTGEASSVPEWCSSFHLLVDLLCLGSPQHPLSHSDHYHPFCSLSGWCFQEFTYLGNNLYAIGNKGIYHAWSLTPGQLYYTTMECIVDSIFFSYQLLFVWGGIPVTYMGSFLFSNSLTASGVVSLVFIFSSFVCDSVTVVVCEYLS